MKLNITLFEPLKAKTIQVTSVFAKFIFLQENGRIDYFENFRDFASRNKENPLESEPPFSCNE